MRATGQLNISDVDSGEAHFQAETLQGAFGKLTMQENGSWQYELDNQHPKIQALGQNTQINDTLIVHAADGTTHKIDISINGTNDSAVISGTNTGTVTEESLLQASGKLDIQDTDTGEAYFQQGDIRGTHGTLHLQPDGQWTYDLDNANPDVQALGTSATTINSLTDTIEVHSADGTKHTITITVNGTNDAPTLNAITAATATEGDATATTGTITSTDIDTGDSAKYTTAATVAGFTLNADGTYSFDPTDAAYNGLAAGDTQKITIPVTVTDGSGGTDQKDLVITITGTNDKPVLDQITAQSATEDGNKVTGSITSTDVDAHESATYSAPNIDGFAIDSATGAYTFDPSHSAYQHLASGQDQTVTIPITVTDQSGGTDTQNLVITVHGTADNAQIAGTDTGITTEETQLQASGTLTISDKDDGQDHFQSGDIVAAHGTLHLNSDGSWTYDLDNTNPGVQALGTSASTTNALTDAIEVHSADGTKHTITITVNGTNDNPVLNTITAATATEGDATATTGTITSTDIDTGDSAKYTTAATVAGFTLNADGTYSFDPTDAAYNGLAAGDTQKITIPVTVTDGSGGTDQKDLVITITGTNDKPVLDQITAQSATEDGNKVTGSITSTDVDAHESATYSAPNIDGFAIDSATGAYTFDPSHSAYQHLASGQDQTVTIPITVTDQSGGTDTQNLVITVHGTADAAVISGVNTGSVTEDNPLQATGQLNITDKDAGQDHFQSGDIKAAHGTLHLNADGSWTYTLDNTNKDVQALGASEQKTDTIQVTAADGTTHSISVTIHGSNDASSIAASLASNTVIEDRTTSSASNELQSAWKNLDTQDVDDKGEAKVVKIEINGVEHAVPANFAMNLAGSHGTFSFTHGTDGHDKWRYTADNTHAEIQGLKDGQSLTDTFTLITADGTRLPITATIQGADDRVVIDTPDALTTPLGTVTEDSHTSVSGTLQAHDADKDDSVSFTSQTTTNAYGTFTVAADGSWHYDLDATKTNALTRNDLFAVGLILKPYQATDLMPLSMSKSLFRAVMTTRLLPKAERHKCLKMVQARIVIQAEYKKLLQAS